MLVFGAHAEREELPHRCLPLSRDQFVVDVSVCVSIGFPVFGMSSAAAYASF